ncbi:hypothetical protein ADK74_11125 [Streptomyces decoyicus]|nr:hypothetical protein ADK74_11125 [Streptomyces decoyicus]
MLAATRPGRPPFEQQDRGVVAESLVLALQKGVDQLAERLGGEFSGRGGADDGVGEGRQAEAAAAGRAGPGHAVGVEQHPVPRLQRRPVDRARGVAERGGHAHRGFAGALRCLFQDLVVADQQGRWMARTAVRKS